MTDAQRRADNLKKKRQAKNQRARFHREVGHLQHENHELREALRGLLSASVSNDMAVINAAVARAERLLGG